MSYLSKREIEMLEIVKSDIKYIKAKWVNNINDHDLRRDSCILRKLLYQDGGLIQKALELLNIQTYKLVAPSSSLDLIDGEDIGFYVAGGGQIDGTKIQSLIYLLKLIDDLDASFVTSPEVRNNVYTLETFLKSPSIILNGKIFSRKEVIYFIANKQGGAHFENNTSTGMSKYKILSDYWDTYELLEKNYVYFEFLSIGQLFVNSTYTSKLLKKINKELKE